MNPRTKINGRKIGQTRNKLGAFGGVFTPSILTILGVIMFMRAGYVIGEVGIFHAILILLIAKSITTLTSLSISAVSTNTTVGGGGAYFLISRALGPEFGGAIGLALFFAQAISVPFYILGFSEALIRTFPNLSPHFMMISFVASVGLFFISFVGAKWTIKTQYMIMTILGLSILTFTGGAAAHFQREIFIQNLSVYSHSTISFWGAFAIYFPAVTGIMAGVNMSGDLKNPGRAIPLGTFAAVAAGLGIYSMQIVLCGGSQTRFQLLEESFETLQGQALFGAGFLVIAGVFAATLSSALGSFLGAPRVLQAVARDNVIPPLIPFARGSRYNDEPHRALFVTLVITLIVIIWAGKDSQSGSFNILAAIVTMFFLYTYGMVNLAAFIESFAENPSFRPRFKYYHWILAVFGAIGCTITASLIDPVAAVIAAVLLFALYALLRRRVLRTQFGDARWGFIYSRLRNNLLRLARQKADPKNWRPTLLVITGDPEERLTLTMYALWIGEERGMVTLARVLVGNLLEISNLRQTAISQLSRFLQENGFEAFSTVVVSRNLDEGLNALIQGHPIGPLQPNLILMGWASDSERVHSFMQHVNSILCLGMSLILLWDKGIPSNNFNRKIDIWWCGQENGSLMVLLAYLLRLNWEWSQANIRVLRLIQDEAGRDPAAQSLRDLVNDARIQAEVSIIVSEDPFPEVLHRHSVNASVVFLGFKAPEENEIETFHRYFEKMLIGLPTTLLVCSSGKADLLA